MEVVFLRPHLQYKVKDKIKVSEERGLYWISTGLVKEYVKRKPKTKAK
jgi:hypothetical protein